MRKKFTILKLGVALLFMLASQATPAQDLKDKALSLVKSNAAAVGLSDDNVLNSRVSDAYQDALTGSIFVYLQQTYMGIDVDKSIQVLVFKNGRLVSAAGKRIDIKIGKNPTVAAPQKRPAAPSVSIESAVQAAAQHLHLSAPAVSLRPAGATEDFSKKMDFGDMGIAKRKITARLIWVPQLGFEKVKLAWEVNLSPRRSSDSWRIMVDAKTGNVIKKENYTIPDDWSTSRSKQPVRAGKEAGDDTTASIREKKDNDYDNDFRHHFPRGIRSVTYRVVPFPAEAPSFTRRGSALTSNPWKLSPRGSGATPFIWNEDGLRQYKFTRGNNVLAQEDLDGNDSVGKRAKGFTFGNNLYFNYVPNFSKDPTGFTNQSFAITNLFYWNNIMHDLSYQYGFDEASGNFQQNNLHRGGLGDDLVYADAQDGGGFANANFDTPPDGENPRMQMFLFPGDPAKGMVINSPASIAGNVVAVEGSVSPNNLLADTGPVTGNVALYNEASDTLHIACDPAANPNELKGKIALLSRGTCAFLDKVLNAQKAGAIAVIIMDNIPGEAPFPWGVDIDSSIVIPAELISYEDGMKIRAVLNTGTAVNITLLPAPYTDGDLDAGVIAHEYTHGISNRLTGGPSTASCLFNFEQMGEGWSDYISLMTITDWRRAHKSDGALAKGIGTYVLNQPTDGPGIRQYPYSTDMTINPHTYADVALSGGEEHNIGEVWASVLWDMTWNIIQMDGINRDIFNAKGEGGNSVAYKLVIEGLKLQPCSPGFIDGRNAILKADTLLYNGKYSCAIWSAFARRGMGVGASQGSSDIAGDEVPDFGLAGILMTKHANKSTAAPGENITYAIGLRARSVCSGQVPQDYSITDSLPGNVTYVSSDGGIYNAATRTVRFNNIHMENGDTLTFRINVTVNNNTSFPDSVYLVDSVSTPEISNKWVAQNGKALAWTTLDLGILLYYTNDNSEKDEEKLVTAGTFLVPGTRTVFSFFHNFATDDFNNGGVVEITTDNGKTWQDLGPYMDPTGAVYTETITGNSVLSGRRAFSGSGIGVTIIDLSPFAGKKVKIRFRYATSDNSFAVPDGGTGWIINDIILSASPSITNTAKLLDGKGGLKALSTVATKVVGQNIPSADFAAVRQNSEALLTWHTPAAFNNGTYRIERSTDRGASFKSIGTLHTIADDARLHPYDFTDRSPVDGLNLYRLTHISSAGVVDYSEVKTVIMDSFKGIKVFPNPTKDRVRVFMPGNNKTATILLIDATGKQVKSYRMSGQSAELNFPGLSHGVYFLNVIRESGISRHKLVIQ